MLCLSGFEPYSRWVPLTRPNTISFTGCNHALLTVEQKKNTSTVVTRERDARSIFSSSA